MTIRNQERRDWSKHILPGATIAHLDAAAIAFARERYKEKMNRPHIIEEVNDMTDEEFLTKIKLMRDGKVTNAAMLLLGNPDYDDMFDWTKDDVLPLFEKTENLIEKMKGLISVG